ncbi:DUF4157 domain-containing protein [Streptomyces sp. NPDC058335]|uniref:eCIS core domain-containing protein n=1 Tax=Streptomyces sp. NPDC058335 TaxID=3346451 RepID=UPI00364DBEEB
MTEDSALPTLGERLDAQGRRTAARLLTTLPWAGPLRVFIGHAAGLVMGAGRFDRIEDAADRPPRFTTTAAARRPRTGDDSSAAAPPTPPGTVVAPVSEAPVVHRPPTAAAAPHGAGDALPAEVRSRLRPAVGPAADAMRVHHDDPSDALARQHRADAVTVGRDVYFRHGRLQPADRRGFGLLVHEATHVLALLRPGASWHRATGTGVETEEGKALASERAVALGGWTGTGSPPPSTDAEEASGLRPQAPARTPAPAPAPAPVSFATPALRPQRADTDRHRDVAVAPPPLDVQGLRRQLIDDVMRQLRTEFERGG